MTDNEKILQFLHFMSADDLERVMHDMNCTAATQPDISSPSWKDQQLVLPYNPEAKYPEVEVPIEAKIKPEKFKYEGYYNRYGGSEISEQEAREQMTDYYYRQWDPLKIKTVEEHYYIPGPDPEKEPMKRKFYNALGWYANYYDGKHGQETEVKVVNEIDISAPIWQNLVLAMAVSGDYTLQQALYAVAMACDRCRHALLDKYYPESGEGYSTDSKKYKNSNDRCQFCRYY